ncbi:MAG: hypothetical protein LC746_00790 [Acidobacteria bacterium]|nr:hypothetical protein [Acidobacteriota bacterium]
MGVSRTFVESVVLLLLTAGLTGLLAPWVLKRVEERRLRRGKIIEAQSKLLDDLSALLWGWRYMTVKVTYYAVKGDAERYAAARKDYDEKVWEVFNDMRRQISLSIRLVSMESYQTLLEQRRYMSDLDREMSALLKNEAQTDEWRAEAKRMHEHIRAEATTRIDDLINRLATELHLKASL